MRVVAVLIGIFLLGGCKCELNGNCNVFITSEGFDGNLGGVNGADARCQQLARAAGLKGIYLAWLSADDGTSPATRFTQVSVPYRRLDGAVIAHNYADLTDGTLENPINLDEKGVESNTSRPWTGTSSSGQPLGANCDNWLSNTETGQTGNQLETSYKWSADDLTPFVPCGNKQRLYCFEQ